MADIEEEKPAEDQTDTEPREKAREKTPKPKKEKPRKSVRMTKAEKQAAREAAANKSKAQQEWEDSLIASKRVKREEIRRKWKRGLLILLVFALITTSVVYIMLLFVEENSVRITASSDSDKTISLSFDRQTWSPYLDVRGPERMWNITYNPDYNDIYKEYPVPTLQSVKEAVTDPFQTGGNWSSLNLIRFCFFLKNTGVGDVPIRFQMSVSYDDIVLANSMRVIWGENFSIDADDRENTSVTCYAARSTDERLVAYNRGIEKIAYPAGYPRYEGQAIGDGTVTVDSFREMDKLSAQEKERIGWVDTTPFQSDDMVFERESYLASGDILCVYVAVWVEGSDFDCTNEALDNYVTFNINFAAN